MPRELKPHEWLREIEKGLDFRQKFGLEQAWGELEALYYNVHPSMANDGPNIIMSTGDSLLASLTTSKSKILVKPRRSEAVSRAPLVESLDNTLLDELNLSQEVDTAALHAFIFGVGWIKQGYDSEYGYDPSFDVGTALSPMGFTLTQLDKKGERRIEHDSGVKPGMPWAKAVAPHDIIVPWGTTSEENCPFIVHRVVRHIDELKEDQKYSNTSRLSPSITMEDFMESYKSVIKVENPGGGKGSRQRPQRRRRFYDGEGPAYVEIYEIHDRRTGRIMAVTPGSDKFLRNDVNALQIENRLPFSAITFTPRSRSLWVTPDAYYLRNQQTELSDLAVQRTKIRRLAVLKFLYDEDVISEEELGKLLSADIGAAAKIQGGGKLSEAILPLQTHPDQTLILEEEHLRRNAREQVGFSRNQLGEFSGGRRTASEARIVNNASQSRIGRRGEAVSRLYRNVVRNLNGIVFEHWTTPRVIEVVGPDAAPLWQTITGPSLKSAYSYEVEFASDEELRARKIETLQLYQMLTQDPSVDPIALRQYLVDNTADPQFERIFNADIQNAMRALRLRNGEFPQGASPQSRGTANGVAGVLPEANGAAPEQALQGLLAGGGRNFGTSGG